MNTITRTMAIVSVSTLVFVSGFASAQAQNPYTLRSAIQSWASNNQAASSRAQTWQREATEQAQEAFYRQINEAVNDPQSTRGIHRLAAEPTQEAIYRQINEAVNDPQSTRGIHRLAAEPVKIMPLESRAAETTVMPLGPEIMPHGQETWVMSPEPTVMAPESRAAETTIMPLNSNDSDYRDNVRLAPQGMLSPFGQ